MFRALILAAATAAGAVSPLVVSPPKDPLADPMVRDGRAYVKAHCVGCHNAQPEGVSLLPTAPPFRLMKTLRPDVLQFLALHAGEGDPTGMPQIVLTPSEAEAASAYIRALANADRPTQVKLGVPTCMLPAC